MTSFTDLGLAAPILQALDQEGYVTPTPIQAQAIPAVLAGRDLVGIAQTGTGKTAAFTLPILHTLAANPRRASARACRVLVLSPTRELSDQILQSVRTYGRHLPLTATLAIGGVPLGRQARAVARGVDVLVATPGRLIDLVQQGAARLDEVEVLVLDEADQMLDMGFIHAIRAIVARCPKVRQNLFFSATMPPAIADLAAKLLRDPVRVAVTPIAKTADRVEQRAILVDRAAKGALLAEMLSDPAMSRALVFTRTKRGADQVVRSLEKAGLPAEAIHGNKSQGQRERALGAFRAGRVRTLVATDIAARGIDVEGVTHVVNYDLPEVPEAYVHRIGRTARAGAAGIAVAFCTDEELPQLRAIEKLTRQQIAVDDRRSNPGRVARPVPVPPRTGGAKTSRPRGSGGGGRGAAPAGRSSSTRHGAGERNAVSRPAQAW